MSGQSRRAETVAIIGAGEMGAAVGERMREAGARLLTTLRGRSAASAERVRRARLAVVDDDDALVREAGFILSIVPPGEALAVAERFCPPLTRAADKPVFADCNAVSPATVRRIADALAPSGCGFVDAAIIGGPPPAGRPGKGPRFYVSGPGAHLLERLRSWGLEIAILDGPVGAASALKMSYAGLTKGLLALGAAMAAGASGAARAGLASALRAELARSQPEMLAWLGPRMPGTFHKAYRWVAEMEQIAEFLGEPAAGAGIYTGMARLYERIAAQFEERERGGADALAALTSFFGR
jgi:putative dehydrogenase